MVEDMKDIVVIGAGGLAREVAFVIEEMNQQQAQWNILGFVEQDAERVGQPVGKYTICCTENDLADREVAVVIGIGNPAIIASVSRRLTAMPNLCFPNLIHPNVIGDRQRLTMGRGNIICAGNVLTTDITLGSFNLLNISCTVGHDTDIGDNCVVNPGVNVSGGVTMDNGVLIGTGATILQYKHIGENAVVGAGAMVAKDVEPGITVMGVPARPR